MIGWTIVRIRMTGIESYVIKLHGKNSAKLRYIRMKSNANIEVQNMTKTLLSLDIYIHKFKTQMRYGQFSKVPTKIICRNIPQNLQLYEFRGRTYFDRILC